ncbi:MAG: SCO family protein, partial [Mariprofundaceae bacterium]|nr:SCO family protein [Mariprofundaceae bacterium]
MKHKRNLFPPILLAIAVALIGFAAFNLRKMPASPYPEIRPTFSLQSIGGPVSIRDIRGKVGVVYFGYTHCPDVCPATLGNIGAALRLLPAKARKKVRAVFITTDPARDT